MIIQFVCSTITFLLFPYFILSRMNWFHVSFETPYIMMIQFVCSKLSFVISIFYPFKGDSIVFLMQARVHCGRSSTCSVRISAVQISRLFPLSFMRLMCIWCFRVGIWMLTSFPMMCRLPLNYPSWKQFRVAPKLCHFKLKCPVNLVVCWFI